jgi:hypothetical protein
MPHGQRVQKLKSFQGKSLSPKGTNKLVHPPCEGAKTGPGGRRPTLHDNVELRAGGSLLTPAEKPFKSLENYS